MLDTTLEQLRHQFITLPEREALALVQKNAADCTAKISSGEMRQQELEKLLSAAEATSATLRKKRERLEQQMKTVIAPREAEALQHEISTVGSEIDAVDEESLAFMEESEHIDSTLVAARSALIELQASEIAATASLQQAEEYKKAEIPMLPVTHGLEFTRVQILLYTVLLFLVTLLPFLTGMSGLIYLICAVSLGALFLGYSIKIFLEPENSKIAFKTFKYSINYLMVLFVGLLVDHYLLMNFGVVA